jgi:hypothetical protein
MTFVSSLPHEALDENAHHIEVFPRLKVKGCSYGFWDPHYVCLKQRSFYLLHSPLLEIDEELTFFFLDLIHVFERLLKPCSKSIQEFL